MTKKIDVNYQMFRGVCAIAVIAIHSGTVSLEASYGIQQYLYVILRNLITFPVPCFFFMSGYFSAVEKDSLGGGINLSA